MAAGPLAGGRVGSDTAAMGHALDHPAADPAVAAAHFAAHLAFETDCADVHDTLLTDPDAIVVVDARSPDAYAAGHVAGAISLPHADISAERLDALGRGRVFVTYCWGPHCNGAHRAAAAIAALGHPVKEMIGGIHGWQLEGFALEQADQPPVGRQPAAPQPEAQTSAAQTSAAQEVGA